MGIINFLMDILQTLYANKVIVELNIVVLPLG